MVDAQPLATEQMERVDGIEELLAKQDPRGALELISEVREDIENDDREGIVEVLARTYYWEQLCWKHLGNLENALVANQKGVELYTQLGQNIGLSNMLRDMGLTYQYVGQYDNALAFLDRSLGALESEEETEEVLSYMGVTNSKKGWIWMEKGHPEKASIFAELGYEQLLKTGHTFYQLTAIGPLVKIGLLSKDYEAAREYISEGRKLLKQLEQEQGYLNERRYCELEADSAQLNIALRKPEEVLTAFMNMMKYMLLTEKTERKRVWDTARIGSIYNFLIKVGFREEVDKYFSTIAKTYATEIDWTPDQMHKELEGHK